MAAISAVGDGDQVLGRDGAQPGGQRGGVVGGEFVGMHLDLEAQGGGTAADRYSASA